MRENPSELDCQLDGAVRNFESWMDGWGGWMDVNAVLRIAFNNIKIVIA